MDSDIPGMPRWRLRKPEGEESNFDNPLNENAMANAILIILILISTTVVAFRLWTRFVIIRERFVADNGLARSPCDNIQIQVCTV